MILQASEEVPKYHYLYQQWQGTGRGVLQVHTLGRAVILSIILKLPCCRRLNGSLITSLEERLQAWTGLPIVNQEDLQVLRYGVGQKYGAHCECCTQAKTLWC